MSINIAKNTDGTSMIVTIQGSIDTVTAPDIQEEITSKIGGVKDITFDFAKVDYISSAGLRMLLLIIRTIGETGSTTLKNVSKDVQNILEMTGFDRLLKIE